MKSNSIAFDTKFILLAVIVLACLTITPGVKADLGTFKAGSCVQIRVLANCSNVNMTEVTTLNKTYTINKAMTLLGGQTFNYTFCNTTDEGVYTFSWNPYCYDCTSVNCGNSFTINGNGKNNQSDNVTLFFILIFLILIGMSCYLGLYTVGHMVAKDFDLIDLSMDFGLYFIVIAIYFLQDFYLGNNLIGYYLLLYIKVGAVMFILVPLIAFIWSFTSAMLRQKKMNLDPPRKLRFRR